MREIFDIAWHRFQVITAITSDATARTVAVLFYFTIFVPFGIGSSLLSDPLRRKNSHPEWLEREAIPNDLDSAKQQG